MKFMKYFCNGTRMWLRLQQITQHERFVPYGTHPNFCFTITSFIYEMLDLIAKARGLNILFYPKDGCRIK